MMGIWGTALYANDTTCDVRDTYIEFLQNGLSNQEAYEKTIQELADYMNDENEEPLFWYALAETQWKVGRLLPEVRDKALSWIEQDGGISLWQDSGNHGAGWKKTITRLKKKLESPMPCEKKIRNPSVPDQNFWNLNDLYAYQFPSGISECEKLAGKYVVLQKIGDGQDYLPGRKMRIQIYDKVFDEIPPLSLIENVRLLPLIGYVSREQLGKPRISQEIMMNRLMFLEKTTDFQVNRFIFLGNCTGPRNEVVPRYSSSLLAWKNINYWLPEFLDSWEGIEYEDVGNGIYRYID